MNKLELKSKDIVANNVEKIRELFPNVVVEGDDGLGIDFELLKQELSKDIINDNKERYQLTWPGKHEAIYTANKRTQKTLRPLKEKSVDFDKTKNIYIEGDNLEVLKILQESYLGKIKCIYIDPPYNTGKDFIYKDNFHGTSKEELVETGQIDVLGNKFVVNMDSSGRYHSDWLNMIYPRLKLARNLLKEDGVIFISIDENEHANMVKICTEIFGEQNYLTSFIWEKKYSPSNDSKVYSDVHEYIVAFAKKIDSWEMGLLERTDEMNQRYKNLDNDPRGDWKPGGMSAKTYNEKYDYPIITPAGNTVLPPTGSCWQFTKEKFESMVLDNRIYFGKDGNSKPQIKQFLSDVRQGLVPMSLLKKELVGHGQISRKEITDLFGTHVFDGPKPTSLIAHLLKIASSNMENEIILDFFSGSSTTGHTVMNINAQEKLNLKYIMVQLPEMIDSKKSKTAFDYCSKNKLEPVITSIAQKRLKLAANKIKDETNANIDYGFRVYKVDESNMKDTFYKPSDTTQNLLDFFESNIKEDRNDLDLLSQVILDLGLTLDLEINEFNFNDNLIFDVDNANLLACFDDKVKLETIEWMAKYVNEYEVGPEKIVVKESAFNSDKDLLNAVEKVKNISDDIKFVVL